MWEEGDSGAQVWLRDMVNMPPTPAHLPHPLAADLSRATFMMAGRSLTFVGSLWSSMSAGCMC